ncbi:MAG: N,N-dimethylformamidase beta subunit family domain-containing protein [Fuerstiella sp.]|nr:hypothetical protein [Fuerstiella sp.]
MTNKPDVPFDGARMPRRDVFKTTAFAASAAASAMSADSAAVGQPSALRRSVSVIDTENRKPGTTDWQLTRVRVNSGLYRTSLIEGYCSRQSVAVGDKLRVFVSTDPARRFQLDVYRMGYYGGTGGCHKATFGPLDGKSQPVPDIGPLPGRLRECQWDAAVEFTIPQDWVSGVYLGKLTTLPESRHEPYWQSYVIFIVKDDRSADLVFQCSDNTWQAYNRWPVNESLYTHPDGSHAPGVAVSFDRPYGKYNQIFDHPLSVGSGEFLLWEFPLSYWLEQNGYDVTYGSNLDTCSSGFINRGKAFISVGHDEYWDQRQFEVVKAAMNRGVSLIWLCGNAVFVDSPFAASSNGRPDRIITRAGCYGDLREDELESYAAMFAGLQPTGPDERDIMGVRSVVPFNGGGDWTCVDDRHWLFDGTGMKAGDSIPGLVGWEHHGEPDPARADLAVVAAGPIWSGGTREGRYEAVTFNGPKQNVVFNASTIFWAQGLSSPPGHIIPWSHFSRPHGPDTRVQQMTKNVIARAVAEPVDAN